MEKTTLIARLMGPTWGPSGTDRAQVGPMLAPWTLLSGNTLQSYYLVSAIWNNSKTVSPVTIFVKTFHPMWAQHLDLVFKCLDRSEMSHSHWDHYKHYFRAYGISWEFILMENWNGSRVEFLNNMFKHYFKAFYTAGNIIWASIQ